MKRFLPTLVLAFSFLFSFSKVYAVPVGTSGGDDPFVPIDQLTTVFGNVLGAIAALIGFAVLLYLILGAFRYMTAQGDPKALGQARQTIFWALAGLVFVIVAFLIIGFIAGFVNIPLLGRFCLPGNPAKSYSQTTC